MKMYERLWEFSPTATYPVPSENAKHLCPAEREIIEC